MTSFVKYSGAQVPPIDVLLDESEREGFAFLRRLIVDWNSGKNRFDSSGETLLLAIENENVVGVGGLNIDPYANDAKVGRIRHVYVAKNHRRCAIGRRLVVELLKLAKVSFREVLLNTDTVEGDLFYSSLGFTALPDDARNSHFVRPRWSNSEGREKNENWAADS